jgi:capsular polysaccharide transport system permease protein
MNWLGFIIPRSVPGIIKRTSLATMMLVLFYYGFWASNRYVSETRILTQKANLTGTEIGDLSSIFNASSSANKADQLLLREYLMTPGVLNVLDHELKLRQHYSNPKYDIVSRMWFSDAPIEWFLRYFLGMTTITYDDYSGTLIIKSQAYTPQKAHEVTSRLLAEGSNFINQIANNLAQSQVDFLEKQVAIAAQRAFAQRDLVIAFQNKNGLLSPQATSENLLAIIAKLEEQRTNLETSFRSFSSYLVIDHPSLVQLKQHIASIERQIVQERSKLAGPKTLALNETLEEFRRLQERADLETSLYKSALQALEQGRMEATRTIKKVAIVQAPTMPEDSIEPKRL